MRSFERPKAHAYPGGRGVSRDYAELYFAVFDSYISHLAVDNKNRISAVKNKIRHAAEIEWNGVESGVSSGENSFYPAVLVITSIYSLQRSLSI